MLSPIDELLQQCTVKIISRISGQWGTGFFVASDRIVTCAHVIEKVGQDGISVLWQGKECPNAKVIEGSIRIAPIDLALLQIDVPNEEDPPCVLLDERVDLFDRLYVYGYPDTFPDGGSLTVTCEGTVEEQGTTLIITKDGQVRPGSSGSPALNKKLNRVCGLVSDSRGRSTNLGGLLISTSTIFDQYPEIRELNRQAHEQSHRWIDLMHQRTLVPTSKLPKALRQDWGDAPESATFYGRTVELNRLKTWLLEERCRTVLITGIGGIGKTAIAKQLSSAVKEEFDYVIWRSLREAPSVEKILSDIVRVLSDHQEMYLADNLSEAIGLLIENYLKNSRVLIVLDNAESVMKQGNQAGQFQANHVGYRLLFNALGLEEHNSCLLLTSREKPQSIEALLVPEKPIRLLELEGLTFHEAGDIFTNKEIEGSREEFEGIFDLYGGNPLFLELAAKHIKEVYQSDVTSFYREASFVVGQPLRDVEDEREAIRKMLDWYFSRLSEEQKEIVYWLAINREPVSIETLSEDVLSVSSKKEIVNNLQSLQKLLPLEKSEEDLYTLQPVLIEYATNRLVEAIFEEISTGDILLLNRHALMKAQSPDYIREAQINFILDPIVQRFDETTLELEEELNQILSSLTRKRRRPQSSYAAGNILNLFCHTELDLASMELDFSRLSVWQADLQGIFVNDIDFSYASLTHSLFTQNLGMVFCTRFSPDGKHIAFGDSHGGVSFIRSSDGQRQWYRSHKNDVWSVAFSNDGKLLVSGDEDGIIKLWNPKTGDCLRTISNYVENPEAVYSVSLDHTGKILAASSKDSVVRAWNTDMLLDGSSNDEPVISWLDHTAPVMSVSFPMYEPVLESFENVLLSGGYDGKVSLLNTVTRECQELYEHNDWIWSVAFSPYGRWVASGSADKTVIIWNVESGEIETVLTEPEGMVLSLTFSRDEKTLAIGGGDGTIRLWSLAQKKYQNFILQQDFWVRSVDFDPEGDVLVSGDDEAKIQFWDVESNNRLRKSQGYMNAVRAIVVPEKFMDKEKSTHVLVSGGDDGIVRQWNYQTGEYISTLNKHEGWVWAVDCSADGRWIASGDTTIKLKNIQTQVLYELSGHEDSLWAVAFSPNSKLLASCSYDKTIRLWNVATQRCVAKINTEQIARNIVFTPDSSCLVVCSDDKRVKRFRIDIESLPGEDVAMLLNDDSEIIFEHLDIARSASFNPAGTLLATSSDDCTVSLIDLERNQSTLLRQHSSSVYATAFSPDGRWLASASADNTAVIWDVEKCSSRHVLIGHTSSVWSIAFSLDSASVFTGSEDGTIKCWSVETGEQSREPLVIYRPYNNMNITGVDLNSAVKNNLRDLGAVAYN